MDYVTLASQQLGGVLGAFLIGVLVRGLALGVLGSLIVGLVGGAAGGLILTQCLNLPPVLLAGGFIGEPTAALVQIASGAAGGAVLAIITRLLMSLVRA